MKERPAAHRAHPPIEDSLEFDLRTPARWSCIPRVAPRTAVALIPCLAVADVRAALRFYERVMGGRRLGDSAGDASPQRTELVIGALTVSLRARLGLHVESFLQLTGGDADSLFIASVRAGSFVCEPLRSLADGSVCGVIRDPFGHRWELRTPAAA